MYELINRWDGECKVVYGRPRHPQSQGLVEQANGTMENMITAGMEQFSTKEWTKLLPVIQFNLNTSKSSSTKFMPFEITFNKLPNVGNKKITQNVIKRVMRFHFPLIKSNRPIRMFKSLLLLILPQEM
jgi:hypothetical protein